MVVFPALLGLVFCLLNLGDSQLFCVTSGCELYAGFSLFGLSFYVYGATGFGLLLLLAIASGKTKTAGSLFLLRAALVVGLLLDMAALGWQILFWPCFNCLVVALLLGAAAAGFWRANPKRCGWLFKGVLAAWAVLLIPVTVAVGKEVALTPWPVLGSGEGAFQVYFSPTCPACEREVSRLLDSPDLPDMAFYPIAKSSRDLRMLATLTQQGPVDERRLRTLFSLAPDPAAEPDAALRWRLAKNKMKLAQLGAKTIPLVTGPTTPRPPQRPADLLFPQADPFSSPVLPEGCGVVGSPDEECE